MLMDYVYRIGHTIFGVYQTDTEDFKQFFDGQATTLGVDTIYVVRRDGEQFIWDCHFGWFNVRRLHYLKPQDFIDLPRTEASPPSQ